MLKRLRAGFTFAEVIAALALVAILSAVTVPVVRNRIQDAYEDALISEFDNLASAIAAYRQDVGKYPPNLDYLTSLRVATTDRFDRCGTALTAADTLQYHGPYVSRFITNSVGYIVATKDTVQDAIVNVLGTNVGLGIVILGPDTLTAHNIDLKVDGLLNATSGTIHWLSVGSTGVEDVALTYVLPTKAGAC
jgi:prepilin-type N-terminal cleavage/methylation domain-containing protein